MLPPHLTHKITLIALKSQDVIALVNSPGITIESVNYLVHSYGKISLVLVGVHTDLLSHIKNAEHFFFSPTGNHLLKSVDCKLAENLH